MVTDRSRPVAVFAISATLTVVELGAPRLTAGKARLLANAGAGVAVVLRPPLGDGLAFRTIRTGKFAGTARMAGRSNAGPPSTAFLAVAPADVVRLAVAVAGAPRRTARRWVVRETVSLGRIAGVRVGINWSALAIVVVIVVGLATGQLPSAYPGRSEVAYVAAAVIAAVLFLASLLAHELAHAVVARRNGVQVHSIVLWLLGGVAQLEGEPRTPGADFRIAVVGPLTSLGVGAAFGAGAAIAAALDADRLTVGVLIYLASTNLLLAVFNLIPAAPLDGGRVLRAALWRRRGDRESAAVTAARAGRVVGFALVGIGLLGSLMTGTLNGIWLALIGWFLISAATAEEQQARMGRRLSGVRVGDVMTSHPVVADATMTLADFADRLALTHQFSGYPLVDQGGRLTGLVTLNRVRAVPPNQRAGTLLQDIACPPEAVPTAHAHEPLVSLLPRMQGCSDGRAVVLDADGRVIGVVSSTDISRALQLADLRSFHAYPPPHGADLTSVGPGRSNQDASRHRGS